MSATLVPRQVSLSEGDLGEIRRLYEAGLYLQAWQTSRTHGDLTEWSGREAQILAGRLAGNIGAPRLASALHAFAYRKNPHDPTAAYYWVSRIFGNKGPFRAWRYLDRLPSFDEAPPMVRSDLLAQRARIHASFRDFSRAESLISEALLLAPDHSWAWCEKASVLRAADANEAALEAAQHALSLSPLYRPAVQIAAELYQTLNRDHDALALLSEAVAKLESGAIAYQLGLLQTELGQHEDAVSSYLRARELHPLAEPAYQKWLNGCLADAYYHVANFAAAREHASSAAGPFYETFAARLATNPSRSRVVLPVQFVAQHHMTCAPATLSALFGFWKFPVDHGALASEICYEGTRDHVERHWIETQGFVVREFKLTWDAARELIDRGVPFSLVTTETTSAHLQAVIGYDLVRETLLLRDPSHRIHSEVAAGPFLERYAAFGPRGMVFLPPGETPRLDGLTFLESDLYDSYYRLQRLLEKHRRAEAAEELDQLASTHPGHRLTLWAQRRLAIYDANATLELEAISGLLALFPNCGHFLWIKASVLGQLAPGLDEHRSFLESLANGPCAEPVFWRDWGRELGRDARRLRQAKRYLTLALRSQPCDGDNLAELANFLWDERAHETAADLYRFAACLPGGGERFGRSYFLAARHLRKTDEALEFLRSRYLKAGEASVQPVRVLCGAYSSLNRNGDLLALLEEALKLRPNDGELLLFAVDEFARHGYARRADELLTTAVSLISRTSWLRTSAIVAGYRSEHHTALGHWREILADQPLATDALRAVTRLLAETEGHAAAFQFLAQRSEDFPHYLPLLELYVEWLRSEPAPLAEPTIRKLQQYTPGNAWCRRELAWNLANQGNSEEALVEAHGALALAPLDPASHGTLGRVLQVAGRLEDAAESLRAALRLSIDYTWAIHGLFSVSPSFEQKRAAVEFVRQELIRQVVFGDGVSAFRQQAFAVLDPPTLLAALREAHQARPDLWQTGVAVIEQLIDMKSFDAALEVASQVTTTFTLLPRAWFEMATVRKARGEWEDEILALTQALFLSPGWGAASRSLSEAYQRRGDYQLSRETLTQAVTRSPLDVYNHGCLAEVLWKLNERESSLQSLQQAIRLDPDYNWGWEALSKWAQELGRPNFALEMARELAANRGGEARSWLRLAGVLQDSARDEALSALDQARQIDPRNVDVHDAIATLLARAGRFDEAITACSPSDFGSNIPVNLQGRAAWIMAERADLVSAVEMMEKVVQVSPDYYWGWACLADWLARLNKTKAALEAAQSMARLAPRAPAPLGYIADLHLQLGQRREAWDAFRKAFDLDPGYSYAGYQLFDGQLKTGDIKEAEKILKLLQLHHPGPDTAGAQIRLLAREQKKKEALEALRQLGLGSADTTNPLRVATAAVIAAGWQKGAEQLFRSLLDDPAANPEIGALWVERFTVRYWWFSHWRLLKLDPRSPIGRAARYAYLGAATTAKRKRLVRALLKRDGTALREDIRCWGQVGYALTSLDLDREVAEWMADWRSQREAQPWMLFNLVLALRVIDNYAESHLVGLHAVSIKGDHTTLKHHLFLAWDEAYAGHLEAAQKRLSIIPSDTLTENFKLVRGLVRALIAVLGAEENDRRKEYETQRVLLKQEAWQVYFRDALFRGLGRKTVAAIAKSAGRRRFRILNSLSSFGPRQPLSFNWRWILYGFLLLNALRACSQLGS
ncbi:hypothetical protein BH09VER1_BH09VER1_38070 [soil metagenome]